MTAKPQAVSTLRRRDLLTATLGTGLALSADREDVELAVKEIDAAEGIKGRPVKLHIEDDRGFNSPNGDMVHGGLITPNAGKPPDPAIVKTRSESRT